mmetsp:Transcript_20977/g.43865  ORF Transcript_20977/g.43865 Transcript_20977/m.43865 type:complete len:231 (+) Transcript_20977:1448-2140(+)
MRFMMDTTRSGASQSEFDFGTCSKHSRWCSSKVREGVDRAKQLTRVSRISSNLSRYTFFRSRLILLLFVCPSAASRSFSAATEPSLSKKPSAAKSIGRLNLLLRLVMRAPFSTSMATTLRPVWPDRIPQCSAVSPCLFLASNGLLRSKSTSATSLSPARAAQCSGIFPSASRVVGSAPAFRSVFTISIETIEFSGLIKRKDAAVCKGAYPASSKRARTPGLRLATCPNCT